MANSSLKGPGLDDLDVSFPECRKHHLDENLGQTSFQGKSDSKLNKKLGKERLTKTIQFSFICRKISPFRSFIKGTFSIDVQA